jgi:hypothetical protein
MGLTKGLRLGEQRRPPKVALDERRLGALAPVADSAIRRGARVALPASRGSDHRRPPSITQADHRHNQYRLLLICNFLVPKMDQPKKKR